MAVGLLLREAQKQLSGHRSVPQLEAQTLLASKMGCARSHLLAFPEKIVEAAITSHYWQDIERLRQGWPLAYLTGQKEFFSLPFRVNQSTFIPRPETELLVEQTLPFLPSQARVLELGTGSGAIILTLCQQRPDISAIAIERSVAALRVAQENARLLHERHIDWRQGDWFKALAADEQFDVLVSNPPYIADNTPALQQAPLCYEPLSALQSGRDGLADIRHLIGGAARYLRPGGWLLLEHGHNQGEAIAELLQQAGFLSLLQRRDLAGKQRISGGQKARGNSS